MKLELDVPKELETPIFNFYQQAKYMILLAEDGMSKVIVLDKEMIE